MAGTIWVIGEIAADGRSREISTEVATLGADARRGAGARRASASSWRRTEGRRGELAALSCRGCWPLTEPATADHAAGAIVGQRLAALVDAASSRPRPRSAAAPDGRDVAGVALGADSAGASWPTRSAVDLGATDRVVEMSVFGGKLNTTSGVHRRTGHRDRPARTSSRPSPRPQPGNVEAVDAQPASSASRRSRSSTGSPRPARAAPIEEARIIVAGGRGVGGPDGFKLVEELAEALGGAVGATRAAVDCRLDPVRPADRPDGQDRQAAAVPRARASPARSSTRSGCRRPRRSSPSTATRTRRSPSSPTSSSSATCSRSCRRSSPRSAPGAAERGAAEPWNRCHAPLLILPLVGVRGPGGPVHRLSCARRPVHRRDPRRRAVPPAGRRPRGADRDVAAARSAAGSTPSAGGQVGADTIGRRPRGGQRRRRRATPTRRAALHPPGRPPTRSETRSSRSWSAPAGRSRWSSTAARSRQPARSGGREIEAQTAIKRGYLNVLHAREAIARQADDRASPSGRRDQRRRLGPRRRPARRIRPETPYVVVSSGDTTSGSGAETGQESDALSPLRERETRVVDSRDLDDSATIRRRRECAACATRFTTYERVEAARLVVVKRDGSRQEFDRDKLASGLRKALTRRPVAGRRRGAGRRRDRGRAALAGRDARSRRRGSARWRWTKLARARPDRLHPVRQRLPELRGPRGAQARGRHALRRARRRRAIGK